MVDRYNIPYQTFQAGDDIESTQFNSDFAYIEDALNELYTFGGGIHGNFSEVYSGTTAPTENPAKVGDIYVNTSNNKIYISKGTSAPTDWKVQANDSTSNVVSVLDYGAIGDDSNDDTDAINNAIVEAVARAGTADYSGYCTVRIPYGKYKVTEQIVIPKNINLACEGVIYNHLTDLWQPCVHVLSGGHCEKLRIWGNLGSGVKFGVKDEYSGSYIGDVRCWNIGAEYDAIKGSKKGIHIQGYNFTFNSFEVDGGNVGIDLETASDVRGYSVLVWGASTSMRITSGCEHIGMGYVDLDTPATMGLQIDSSHDIHLNARCFLNDQQTPSPLSYACKIGQYSVADPVNNLNLTLNCQDTGGTGLYLGYISSSNINLTCTNDTLGTGNDNDMTKGFELGTGVASDVYITANIDDAIGTAYTGTGGMLNTGFTAIT